MPRIQHPLPAFLVPSARHHRCHLHKLPLPIPMLSVADDMFMHTCKCLQVLTYTLMTTRHGIISKNEAKPHLLKGSWGGCERFTHHVFCCKIWGRTLGLPTEREAILLVCLASKHPQNSTSSSLSFPEFKHCVSRYLSTIPVLLITCPSQTNATMGPAAPIVVIPPNPFSIARNYY